MQSYLQRHMRTHFNMAALPDPTSKVGGGAKDRVAVKANMGGVTTSTTLLNPITLETSGNNGSFIVSQPALNIPPNSSQNYFMIQTVNGLQLIPLSTPAPVPPPPPPPPPQNFILLQCPSNNGGLSNLILVPTANPSSSTELPQALPVLHTVPTMQPVVGQAPQFQNISQQARMVLSKNQSSAQTTILPPTHILPPGSLMSKPILGKSTRQARKKRGRKPKNAQQIPEIAAGSCLADKQPLPPPVPSNPLSKSVTSPTEPITLETSGPQSDQRVPAETKTGEFSAPAATAAELKTSQLSTTESVESKEFVLCFDKESVDVEGSGGSFMLQFDGETSGQSLNEKEMEKQQGKSVLLQFNTDQDLNENKGEKARIMSLLQNFGDEKQSESHCKSEDTQTEYVLHFHAEDQHTIPQDGHFNQEHGNSLTLTCTSNQDLGSLDRQEVVFELEDATKLEQEQEGVQMITLIEGNAAEGNGTRQVVAQHEGPMESVFQLQGSEEIVIIEVNTSGIENGGGEKISDDVPAECLGVDTKANLETDDSI